MNNNGHQHSKHPFAACREWGTSFQLFIRFSQNPNEEEDVTSASQQATAVKHLAELRKDRGKRFYRSFKFDCVFDAVDSRD